MSRSMQERGLSAIQPGKVDPHLWFECHDAERVDLLLEESVSLPKYGAVFTLLWAAKMERRTLPEEKGFLEELDPKGFTLDRERWPR